MSLKSFFNTKSFQRETAGFLVAATAGDNEAISAFLNKYGTGVVDNRGSGGLTALMFAAWAGKKETVELLLAKGADINNRDDQGRTVLMLSALGGHKDTTVLLMQKKGDIVEEGDVYSKTGIQKSVTTKHGAIFRYQA